MRKRATGKRPVALFATGRMLVVSNDLFVFVVIVLAHGEKSSCEKIKK